jgi:periplasmic protein TonB
MREALAYAVSAIFHVSLLAWLGGDWDEPPQLLAVAQGRASVALIASIPAHGDPHAPHELQEFASLVETTVIANEQVADTVRQIPIEVVKQSSDASLERNEDPVDTPLAPSDLAVLLPLPPPPIAMAFGDKPNPTGNKTATHKRQIKAAGLPMHLNGVGNRPPSPASMGSSGADVDLPSNHFANHAPAYPPESLFAGHEGTVLMRVHISTTGTVAQLSVEQSSGYPLLDESALRAVRYWRFIPGKKAGRPAQFEVLIPVRFTIRSM